MAQPRETESHWTQLRSDLVPTAELPRQAGIRRFGMGDILGTSPRGADGLILPCRRPSNSARIVEGSALDGGRGGGNLNDVRYVQFRAVTS